MNRKVRIGPVVHFRSSLSQNSRPSPTRRRAGKTMPDVIYVVPRVTQ
jgi:hypothetical protein